MDETTPVYTNLAGEDPSSVTVGAPEPVNAEDALYPGDKFEIILRCYTDNATLIATGLAQIEPTLEAMHEIEWLSIADRPDYKDSETGDVFHAIIYTGEVTSQGSAPLGPIVISIIAVASAIAAIAAAWDIVVWRRSVIYRAAAGVATSPNATPEDKAAAAATMQSIGTDTGIVANLGKTAGQVSNLVWAGVAIGGLLVLHELFGRRGKEVSV